LADAMSRLTPSNNIASIFGEALRTHDFAMEILRVSWKERGWPIVLRNLQQRATDWRGRWVLLQYTALAWSPRAFPLEVPARD